MGSCHLCAYIGSGNLVFDEIMSYVTDNTQRVHINELASHVKTALLQQLQIDDTGADPSPLPLTPVRAEAGAEPRAQRPR